MRGRSEGRGYGKVMGRRGGVSLKGRRRWEGGGGGGGGGKSRRREE